MKNEFIKSYWYKSPYGNYLKFARYSNDFKEITGSSTIYNDKLYSLGSHWWAVPEVLKYALKNPINATDIEYIINKGGIVEDSQLNEHTTKRTINSIKNGEVIHCPTLEEAQEFCLLLDNNAEKWKMGESYIDDNRWNTYKENTCYSVNTKTHGSKDFYLRRKRIIINVSEFLQDVKLENNSFTIKIIEG